MTFILTSSIPTTAERLCLFTLRPYATGSGAAGKTDSAFRSAARYRVEDSAVAARHQKTVRPVVRGSDLFVAVGGPNGESTIITSPDGITWTARVSNVIGGLKSITWGNNLFVAVGNNGWSAGVILTSPDGITWTSITSGTANFLNGVAWGNNQFVAISPAAFSKLSTIISSTNGSTWSTGNSGSTYDLYNIVWGNNCFIAVGLSGTILTTASSSSVT